MTLFYDFGDALSEWRDYGGAMNYHHGDSKHDPAWEVLEQMNGVDAKQCTIHALEMGGLSEEEIEVEMATWNDQEV